MERRELLKDGLAATAAFLSGATIASLEQREEEDGCRYYEQPTHSVTVSNEPIYCGRFDNSSLEYENRSRIGNVSLNSSSTGDLIYKDE